MQLDYQYILGWLGWMLAFLNVPTKEKKKEIRPMTKIRKPMDNTKTLPKTSITQRLRTDLGQSVGVTTVIQLVWLYRFMGTQPSH